MQSFDIFQLLLTHPCTILLSVHSPSFPDPEGSKCLTNDSRYGMGVSGA